MKSVAFITLGCLIVASSCFGQHAYHASNAADVGASATPSSATTPSTQGLGSSPASTVASTHGGQSSTPCQDATLQCARAATPLFTSDGALWLAWAGGGAISIARSTDLGASFEPSKEIARHGAFLDTGPDARPQLVSDEKNNVVLAYGFFRDKNWNAQINTARSLDGGQTFSKPEPLSRDASSQRFPSLLRDAQGQIFASWIDKRVAAQELKAGKKHPGGSIAYAWSPDFGKTFLNENIAQPNSCECCRIATSLTPEGLPVILYRAIFDGTVRDHATQNFTSRTQPGTVTRVSVDDWATDSCPHHGPALAIARSGVQHVAWFTQGSVRTGSFYARSTDGGQQYSAPVAIGNPQAMPGRPYLLATPKGLWLTWKEFDGKHTTVLTQYSSNEGVQWSAPKLVAETTGYSDHPLLIQRDGVAYLSWLTAAQGYRLLKLEADIPASAVTTPALVAYQRGDWKKILQSGAGKPHIVHFWGYTCGPCLEELPRWGQFLKETPNVRTTFIEVDQVPLEVAAQAVVQAGLSGADNRSSASVFDEYMRYEIDPTWLGELPITMLVDASGVIKRLRGVVNFAQVNAWLKAQ